MNIFDSLNKFVALEGKEDDIIEEITKQKETQEFLIFVLQEQLFQSGEDGKGVPIGMYSPFTITIKKRKGQPTDRVTLKDTGDFYNSYTIKPFNGGFIIDADGEKEDKNLFDIYGDDILLPSQESLDLIAEYYEEQLIEYIKKLFI